MKAIVFVAVAALGLGAAGVASASEDLAKSSGCLTCHATDTKKMGPSFKDIAAKYKGQVDAVAKLSDKVRKGGAGVWGPIPMPPNAAVPDADIKALVAWVLAGAK